jgi:hypothetical protein
MVATDTVVGVTGAVLLAAVMVGVFVYEYNNTPAGTGGGSPDAKIAAFASAYPTLNATDDMDGDGNPNFNDTDMDGHGGPDIIQKGDLRFVQTIAGQTSNPAQASDRQDVKFPVVQGETGFHAVLNYTVAFQPDPLGAVPALPSLSMKLVGPDGKEAGTATRSQSGTTVTLTLEAQGPLVKGEYFVSIQVAQPGPQTSYSGQLAVTYVPPHAEGA